MKQVVFVTGNQQKAERFSRHIGVEVEHAPAELDELQSTNVVEIVSHKVRQAFDQIGSPVLIEDVSFTYEALGSLPGPFIKFFVDEEDGSEKLCRMLDGFGNRRATASCTFGYFDGQTLRTFYGEIHGTIAEHPRGTAGYGFDRIFQPDGFGGKTAGELSEEEYEQYYLTVKPLDKVREFIVS